MKRSINEMCSQFFSKLANPTRIAILGLLREGTKNETKISEALNQGQSMISHNLRSIERYQFIFSARKKKKCFYSLNKELMEQIFKAFHFHAQKYCPTEGRCLTDQGLEKWKKQEVSTLLHLARY